MNEETISVENTPAPSAETGENITNDYKADLERERKQREQAEYTLKELRRKKAQEIIGELDVSEIVSREVEKATAHLREEVARTTLQTQISRIASSPEEAEAILHHFSHSIRTTGNLVEDVENAKLLANKSRILKENEEYRLRTTLSTNQPTRAPGSGAGQKVEHKEPITFSPFEQKMIDRGMTKERVLAARNMPEGPQRLGK